MYNPSDAVLFSRDITVKKYNERLISFAYFAVVLGGVLALSGLLTSETHGSKTDSKNLYIAGSAFSILGGALTIIHFAIEGLRSFLTNKPLFAPPAYTSIAGSETNSNTRASPKR